VETMYSLLNNNNNNNNNNKETNVTVTPKRAKRIGSPNCWEGSRAESVIWAETAKRFMSTSFTHHQEKISEVLRVKYTTF
jgi:hypothetical protein